MKNQFKVTNEDGRCFLVQVVQGHEPMVEFYDFTFAGPRFGPLGQFVARYYASTLLEGNSGGLNLQGGVPEWQIDNEAMDEVRDFIRSALRGPRSLGQYADPIYARPHYERDEEPEEEPEFEEEFNEPDEGDWVTTDHREFFSDGKLVLRISDAVAEDDRKMWKAIDAKMKKDGFFPNVWFISDHGNADLMSRLNQRQP